MASHGSSTPSTCVTRAGRRKIRGGCVDLREEVHRVAVERAARRGQDDLDRSGAAPPAPFQRSTPRSKR